MTITTRLLGATLVAMPLVGGAMLATGCHHEGPAERAGKKIDKAVDDAKDAVDPDGPAEDAGEKVDRAVDDLKD